MRTPRSATATALAALLALALPDLAHAAPERAGSTLSPVDLRTDDKVDPIGIDATAPLLSWRLDDGGRGGRQAAYEIRAARTADGLRAGKGAVWHSGKVRSAATNKVAFPARLKARDSVVWQVRIWDEEGRGSGWSAPAAFEMGLLNSSDWSARWIENPAYDYTSPDGKEMPLPVFGKAFTVSGQVARARLYLTGLGMYAATLNGRPFAPDVLEPGQTTYSAEVDYRTYDLTGKLRSGANTLGIETGSGAYQRVKTPGHYFFGGSLETYTVFGEPKVIAQLEITYKDGRRQTVTSDTSWRTALGPTTYSSWWSGEEYDARRAASAPTPGRLEGPGWQDAALAQLTSTTTPRDTTPLRADPRPPVTVARTVRPVSVKPAGSGSYILDFGANYSGWPHLKVTGAAGTTVTLIPSERINADGSLNIASTGATATNRIAYRYTLAGQGTENWHPQFTYSGFRYLKVDGLPAAPAADTVTLQVVHASNERAGDFSSSSALLDEIHAITLRAMQGNMMSVLTDCPDREKGPYTGDNLHNIDALLTDYDLSAYENQLVRNMATAQRQPGDEFPGLIANIAPEFHRVAPVKLPHPQGIIEYLDEVNWGGAVVRIPWKLYRTYGDTRTMSEFYDTMARWLAYEDGNKAANNGDIPGLGDWSATDNSTPMQLAIVAGHYTAVNDMAQIAGVLGKTADRDLYAAKAQTLATEFNDRFRHTDANGVYYGSDSETSNAMALDAGLVAPAEQAQVLARLVAAVRRAGNHITSGSVGIGPLFRALHAGGRDDVVYDMVVNPTSPGYGYLVASGHTTLAESLTGSGSQNHHFFGQVDAWLVAGPAGIDQTADSVGYRKLEIAPQPVGGLTHAAGSYRTPQGMVSSSWRKDGHGQFVLDIAVPAGSSATVRVPAAKSAPVTASGTSRPHPTGRTATTAVYQVPAGTFTFTVS